MSPSLVPLDYGWWLASRAAGITALIAATVSVALGLAMAGKVSRRPGMAKALLGVHEHTALIALVAIAAHGILLLGDGWLHPTPSQIALPFTMDYRPVWSGLGVIGGWLAAVLGLSYYGRKRLGVKRWRAAHRATILVWVLGVAHALGAGSDVIAMRVIALVSTAVIVPLFALRVLGRPQRVTARPARPQVATRRDAGVGTEHGGSW